jgi:hypothetical protein
LYFNKNNNQKIISTAITCFMMTIILTSPVYASTLTPFQSGYDHGCDDAKIPDSNKNERYIEQPGKGRAYHTVEFMNGYEYGFTQCKSSGEGNPGEGNPSGDSSLPIDAAFMRDPNGKLYIFKGNQFVRLTFQPEGGAEVDQAPQQISQGFRGMPSNFNNGIDAAFINENTGKLYLFRGDQFVRLTFQPEGGAEVDQAPQQISQGFRGIEWN